MPSFRYKAYGRDGRVMAGTVAAAGQQEAVKLLRSDGLFPFDVSEEKGQGRSRLAARFKEEEVSVATRQLATLLSTGSNLTESLSVLIENLANPALKALFQNVKDSVTAGNSLARSLEEHPKAFSALYRNLVAAGEASGSLDVILSRLADFLERRAYVIKEAKSALTYPALMTMVAVSVLALLFAFVIPKVTGIFEESGRQLPFLTVALLAVSGILRDWWWALLLAFAAALYSARKYIKTEKGRLAFDSALLKAPWFGPIVTDFYVSNLARTLATLLRGGVHMLKAIEITMAAAGNTAFKQALAGALRECAEGLTLSASLKKSGVLPPLLVHMTGVGERSGRLDDVLFKAAEAFEQSFETGVKKTISLLEPALVLIMGVIVGLIVTAILLPIFELSQTIG